MLDVVVEHSLLFFFNLMQIRCSCTLSGSQVKVRWLKIIHALFYFLFFVVEKCYLLFWVQNRHILRHRERKTRRCCYTVAEYSFIRLEHGSIIAHADISQRFVDNGDQLADFTPTLFICLFHSPFHVCTSVTNGRELQPFHVCTVRSMFASFHLNRNRGMLSESRIKYFCPTTICCSFIQ